MTTLICILVGLGTVILVLGAIIGTVTLGFWLEERVTWRPPQFVDRLGNWVGGCSLILFASLLIYALGCAVGHSFGWIDDCPTCKVEEVAP